MSENKHTSPIYMQVNCGWYIEEYPLVEYHLKYAFIWKMLLFSVATITNELKSPKVRQCGVEGELLCALKGDYWSTVINIILDRHWWYYAI